MTRKKETEKERSPRGHPLRIFPKIGNAPSAGQAGRAFDPWPVEYPNGKALVSRGAVHDHRLSSSTRAGGMRAVISTRRARRGEGLEESKYGFLQIRVFLRVLLPFASFVLKTEREAPLFVCLRGRSPHSCKEVGLGKLGLLGCQ